jgi:hypothetical protein
MTDRPDRPEGQPPLVQWVELVPAVRTAIAQAEQAGATNAEMATLALLVRRAFDRSHRWMYVSPADVVTAGITPEQAGRRLKRLEELGVLWYWSARHKGDRGVVELHHAGTIPKRNARGERGQSKPEPAVSAGNRSSKARGEERQSPRSGAPKPAVERDPYEGPSGLSSEEAGAAAPGPPAPPPGPVLAPDQWKDPDPDGRLADRLKRLDHDDHPPGAWMPLLHRILDAPEIADRRPAFVAWVHRFLDTAGPVSITDITRHVEAALDRQRTKDRAT